MSSHSFRMNHFVDCMEPQWFHRNPTNNRYRLSISPKYCCCFIPVKKKKEIHWSAIMGFKRHLIAGEPQIKKARRLNS